MLLRKEIFTSNLIIATSLCVYQLVGCFCIVTKSWTEGVVYIEKYLSALPQLGRVNALQYFSLPKREYALKHFV